MTHENDLSQRSPEEIESRIVHTRKALDRKLEKLEERLDPRARLGELKHRVSDRMSSARHGLNSRAPELAAWGAVGAVVAGGAMALSGWKRRQPNGHDATVTCEYIAEVPLEHVDESDLTDA